MSRTARANHWIRLENVRRKDQRADGSSCNPISCAGSEEVRVIEHIEELSANLHIDPVTKLDQLGDRHIPVVETWSAQDVAPHIAKLTEFRRSHDRASLLVAAEVKKLGSRCM